jgi:type IV secretory pathway VirB10-like protein
MDDQSLDSNQPPLVPSEIPSAVSSGTSLNKGLWIILGILTFLAIYFVKGGKKNAQRTLNDNDFSAITPVPVVTPALPVPSVRPLLPPAAWQSPPDASLRDARRKSPVVLYTNTAATPGAGSGPSSSDPAAGPPMPSGFHPTNGGAAHTSTLGDREFIIAEGKLLDAILETGINTDHPGMLRALISDDIYGDTGRTVLLPRGSRLIGQYDADVAQGQSRVFVIWQRAIRPDGIDVALGSDGTDALGQAGLAGNINRHFFTMFGAATLLSIIGASAATVGVGPQDAANSAAAYRSSIAQGFNEATNNVMSVFVRIKPTITVPPGTTVKVFVARDLYFDPAAVASRRVQVIP